MAKHTHVYQCDKCHQVMVIPAIHFRGNKRKTWDQPRECSHIRCDGKGRYLYTYRR